MGEITTLLQATQFAAEKHKTQRRKGVEASPYINHPIQVAELIARVGEVEDIDVLVAAVLHDTVEDTETTFEELENLFGQTVKSLVEEVTDDKSLPKTERKKMQVEHAAHISAGAKLIKIADKTCNISDLNISPPEGWDIGRKLDYLDWSEQVVDKCRGTNEEMELYYDEMLRKSRDVLGASD